MTDKRKSIAELKAEYDEDRHLYGKPFYHNKSREDYQLLFPAWDEQSNEKQAVYVLSSMPWLKFTRPFDEFKLKFTQGRSADQLEEE